MTTVARTPRHYPRAKVAAMKAKAKATMRQMVDFAMAERVHRECDPFEQAKLTLRRRGIIVFAQRVVAPGGEDLIVVGTRKMTRDEVIQFASRFQ